MKHINFYPKSKLVKEVVSAPQPVRSPNWYKDAPIYENLNDGSSAKSLIVDNGNKNHTVKACIPFFDALTAGYTFNLWCDIQVSIVNGATRITWLELTKELEPVGFKLETHVPTSVGYTAFNFSWLYPWGIKTPKGYSCLFTHPVNRHDLPFLSASGIIDTDTYGLWGPHPFAIQKDWVGVIPAGTPIIQVIPFKRDEWKSSIDESLTDWGTLQTYKRNLTFRGYYKNNFWHKKKYS
jgi:hypothetical protein